MRAILLLILAYPFLEVASLVYMADHFGGGFVLGWVVVSALIGVLMLRNQKVGALLTLGAVLRKPGEVSLYGLLWPLRFLLAGVLFLIPGFISDVLAVLLLLPLKGPSLKVPPAGGFGGAGGQTGPGGDGAIEGEYTRVDETVDPDRRLHK